MSKKMFDQMIAYETSARQWTGTFREWIDENVLNMGDTEVLSDEDTAGCFNLISGKLDTDYYQSNVGTSGFWRIRILPESFIWRKFKDIEEKTEQLMANVARQKKENIAKEYQLCHEAVEGYKRLEIDAMIGAINNEKTVIDGQLHISRTLTGQFCTHTPRSLIFDSKGIAPIIITTDRILTLCFNYEKQRIMVWLVPERTI